MLRVCLRETRTLEATCIACILRNLAKWTYAIVSEQAKIMSTQRNVAFQKANGYCARAIICLSIAMLFFGVGVFGTNPESVLGIIALCIGLVFVLASYVFFALYGRYSNAQ